MEIKNIAKALCAAQSAMSGAKKSSKNPFFKSNYADLSSVFDAIREPFALNGLSVVQTLKVLEGGAQALCTILMHSSGESIESIMILPMKDDPQKTGSLITYYRRYALMAIAGIPAEDDDGNKASDKELKTQAAVQYITQDQVNKLNSLLEGHGDIRQVVLTTCGGNLSTVPADKFMPAVEWIKELIAKSRDK